MLRVDSVSLVFSAGGTTVHAVRDASLTVARGEFLGLVGPSGSGKSSLVYLMSTLKRPTSGEVYFNNLGYTRLSADAMARLRRQHFGFVFQQNFLINYLSCLENVLLGAKDPYGARERAATLLAELGLAGRLHHRPHQLSVGQRQLVSVVRAIIHEPEIIFADEPTASLDRRSGHLVVDILAQYRHKGAVVVVTHDQDMLRDADRVIGMRDGLLQV